MSDHRHEPYDIYGTAATSGEVSRLESTVAGLREDLAAAEGRIRELARRIEALERSTPQAHQLQHEADIAAADLAESGFDNDPPVGADRHGPGCLCPYCPDDEPEPEDCDPGPEADDEGGMSEYRYMMHAELSGAYDETDGAS
jgi:hypothetical protein